MQKTTKKECKQKTSAKKDSQPLAEGFVPLSDLLDLQVVGIELSQKPIHRQHHTLHILAFLLLLRPLDASPDTTLNAWPQPLCCKKHYCKNFTSHQNTLHGQHFCPD